MRTDIHIGVFNVFIFLGVFQGLFLSWFFIKNGHKDKKANLYQGLLLLFLSLNIFEEWLNNTGYIVKVLPITNFSEPTNFTFAPLLYLYVISSLNPEGKRKEWVHFILAMFWLIYMVFQFIQPNEIKYNSYIDTKHPDWGYLNVPFKISDDPIGIRMYINQLTAIQLIIYLTAVIVVIIRKLRSLGQTFFNTDNELLIVLRNTLIHFLLIFLIYISTKIYFGMGSDVGGYLIATYISFMIYSTSYQVLNRSEFFNQPGSFLTFPMMKYQKSSLSEENKELILTKIRKEMEVNAYFTNNLASLSGLAKQINESSHHVSQVINEKLNKNFFELLASYRVDHAKKLIEMDKDSKLTVEELADMVGYNSKSSFNNAFKTITAKTPSEYRKSLSKQ
jgi:AraC-like DNA-binding protein